MKPFFTFFLANLLASSLSLAQSYKPFSLQLALGYAKPVGASGGLSLQIEPKYALTSHFEMGIRLSLAVMARQIAFAPRNTTGEAKGVASALVTGHYYLTANGFRPFVGAGIGVYSFARTALPISIAGQDIAKSAIAGGNQFGGMIQAGFKVAHVGLSLAYNILPRTVGIAAIYPGDVYDFVSKSSYGEVTASFAIGGVGAKSSQQ
ncbi:hypothetical protein GO730_18000 [Spirosoma sp. HMF3257]|uniref:Outer membrane beta-barrel protein n=1 Tax=Spirosoma telluris TaxID=2183553 RepID=A0A327NJP3_9BACT|nr:hypothetical protein [Spirosoma telluris]RAI75571.1 hypothetical protein HMF3257_17920 [Spirosoma telluris]